MVVVNCALRQDDIINIVEGLEIEGQKPFKFNSKQGLQIFFDSTYGDDTKAASIIKSEIMFSFFLDPINPAESKRYKLSFSIFIF